jgi:glycosyltransferase involved in cell wall biosynthesis
VAERWIFRAADGFVVLTERARGLLFPEGAAGRPIEVIPCCVDQARFEVASGRERDAVREELGLRGRLVFVYAGTLGGSYLTNETADLFASAREANPQVYALVLTQSSPAAMTAELAQRGFSADDCRVMQAAPDEVPAYLRAADIAVALVRHSYARQSTSLTKFAEYLAAGLPVIATAGVGDLDEHIEEGRVGVLLYALDGASYIDALRAIEELRRDPLLAERCHGEARARYDLQEVGGLRYRRLYDAVLRA